MTWIPGQGLVIPTQWGIFTISGGGFVILLLAAVFWRYVVPIVCAAMAGEKGARYFVWAIYALIAFMVYGVFRPLIVAATGVAF